MRAILINPFDRTVTEIDVAKGLTALYAALSGPGLPLGDGPIPEDPAAWEGLTDAEGKPRLRDFMEISCLDIRGLGGDIDLIVDDDGRLIEGQACFTFDGVDDPTWMIAGRALLMTHDRQGNTRGTEMPLDYAAAPVRWLPYNTDYEPPVPRVIAMSSEQAAHWMDTGELPGESDE